MDRMGEQLFSRSCLPNQQHRRFRSGHFAQNFLGIPDSLRLTDHIVKAVFCPVALAFFHQLAPEFILPALHFIKFLKNSKGSYALFPSEHRPHIDADQASGHTHHLGFCFFLVSPALVKRNIRKYPAALLIEGRIAQNMGDIPGHGIDGVNISLLIYSHHSLVQYIHQHVELRFQPAGTAEHLVKIVGIGAYRFLIIPKPLFLQKLR